MADDLPDRRAFLTTAALAAGALAVGCDDAAEALPEGTDARIRDPDVQTLDGSPSDARRPPPDAGPDAAADRGPDPDTAPPDSAPVDAEPTPDAVPDAVSDAASDAVPDAAEIVDAAPDAATPDDAGPDAGPPFDPEADLPLAERFPLGVGSGDVEFDRAILWTRHTGNTALEAWIWTAVGGALSFLPAIRAEGGFVHVDAGDLTPGARYRFLFAELDAEGAAVARSPIGTFRAAIAPDAMDTVVFGACSCTSNGNDFDTLADAADRADLDLFLLLGDTTYADAAISRADYRGKWAENLETAPYRALRASTSTLATWDDHEVTNNWNPEAIDVHRIAAARGAFFEHLPLRRDPMAPDRIWKSVRWGRTVEFFVLDCRGERRPSERLTPEAQYISDAQFDWLLAGLRASEAVFKVVLSSVPTGDFPYPFDDDRWSGYPAQRDALLVALDGDDIDGVVFVSGDFHHASAGRLTAQGPGSDVPEFLCGPGGQFPNPGYLLLPGLPQFDWSIGINNYTVFTLDPVAREVHVAWISPLGRVLHETIVGV